MQPTYQQEAKTKLISTIMTIVVVAGIILIADHIKSESSTAAASLAATTTSQRADPSSMGSTATTTSTSASSTPSNTSNYKDGTYSTTSSYYVPHGNESIKVTFTLSNGVISSSTIANSEGDRVSAQYQQGFASEYKSYVVGKKIADVRLGVVAGASDTSQGFKNAVSQILSKAQA